MLSLNKLRLVFLVCGFFTFCDPVKAQKCGDGSTTTGSGSLLQPSCANTTYNPRRDTCCKTHGNREGHLTVGLSERMSQCCGEKAYNPLNEICCDQTVKPKPSHGAKCCGKVPYDEKKKVCCSNQLLEKHSPSHLCCYGKLFDSNIENCCQNVFPRIQLKISNSEVCGKNLTFDPTCPGEDRSQNLIADNQINEPNGSGNEKTCEHRNEKEVYLRKGGFICCGHYYVNTALWTCKGNKLIEKTPK